MRSRAKKIAAAILLATVEAILLDSLLTLTEVRAFPDRSFRIPNGLVNDCSNCHIDPDGGGPRTLFGKDVRKILDQKVCEELWCPDLAMLDSDEDGRTNGEELLDPDGLWIPGDDPPGDSRLVTHPGLPDSLPPRAPFVRGDINADGSFNIADPVKILLFLFVQGGFLPCNQAADLNDDSVLDVADAVYALQFLFRSGEEPRPPYPDCDQVSAGKITCIEFPPCAEEVVVF